MLKLMAKRLAGVLGYSISRSVVDAKSCEINREIWGDNPFADMSALVRDIECPIVFDVGAYHGEVSLEFRNALPNSRVFAFEPFPSSFDVLKANTSVDSAIRVFPVGLADSAGNRLFSSNEHAPANSLFETDRLAHETWGRSVLETRQQIEVPFETIDGFMCANDIKRIDILKLDCQGAEPLVVRGAADALNTRKVGVIYAEIILQPTYVGQQSFHESLLMYETCGFELFNLYNLSLKPNGFLRQVDAIFVRRS